MKVTKEKFKNPYFILGIIAIIFSSAGVDIGTLTNWKLFIEAILSILNNPFAILCVVVAILGVWNDNSSSGLDKLNIFAIKKDK